MFFDSYRLGERSVLRKGTKFRVGLGPYYVTNGGEHVSMAFKGIVTFLFAEKNGEREYIHATTSKGANVLLHVKGERTNPLVPGMVCRPYKIRGRVRTRRKAKA